MDMQHRLISIAAVIPVGIGKHNPTPAPICTPGTRIEITAFAYHDRAVAANGLGAGKMQARNNPVYVCPDPISLQ